MQVLFSSQAKLVVAHPGKMILATLIFVNTVIPGALLGTADLRNEEIVLPNDARELDQKKRIDAVFGHDYGFATFIFSPSAGGDMLNVASLRALASAEEAILSLVQEDPDYTATKWGWVDVCARMQPAGPCYFASILGPGTPWNPNGTRTPTQAMTALETQAAQLKAANPNSPLDGIHLAVSQLYQSTRTDPYFSGVFGQITPPGPGSNHSALIGSMSHLKSTYLLNGVERKTLNFRIWEFVAGDTAPMTKEERWESKVLEWAEAHATHEGNTLQRFSTRSLSTETLQMALWSMPLVTVTLNLMVTYVLWVFVRKPFKVWGKPRAKLALAGVAGVQLASTAGICFATMVQIPASFGAQFVMFIVLGIGLDGVFLMNDTFDHAPISLSLEERIEYTMTHTGPSILIASATDIFAFLTAAFTPIPIIQYFCVTVAMALVFALVILNTWFVAWMYRIEKARMAAAKEAGDEQLALPNGGALVPPSPMQRFFADTVSPMIVKPAGKATVIGISLVLIGTAPIGVSQVTPKYSFEDFVLGCGVLCDPSYVLDYWEESDASFELGPSATRMMFANFDVNKDHAKYEALLANLGGTTCPGADSCQALAPGSTVSQSHPSGWPYPVATIQPMSWYTAFCAQPGTTCGASSTYTAADVKMFVDANPDFGLFLRMPADLTTSVLPYFWIVYPLRQYEDTEQSMDALDEFNKITDGSGLDVAAYTPSFAVISMYQSIKSILYSSLAMALAVAFGIMLLSVDIKVALCISIIVVMVDFDLFAAIYFFNNNLAPFSYAAIVISVGLCLDYSIHLAQEFMICDKPDGDSRAQEAVQRVGKAVFNGGFTTFLGMAILSCGPGKAFYGFGHLFLYMVVLGLFHGLFVLPVILSIINPSSISDIIIKTEIAAAKTETETQKEEGAEAEGEQAEERGQKKLQTQATSNP